MLLSDEFWQSVVFGAIIGGVITVLLLKLLDKDGAVLGNTAVRNESKKLPIEHDDRSC